MGQSSEYEQNILVYTSGRIQRSLLEGEACHQCATILENDDVQITCDFLELKDFGGLIRPHKDVFVVVKVCEKVFKSQYLTDSIMKNNIFDLLSSKSLMMVADYNGNVFDEAHFFGTNHRQKIIKKIIEKYFNMRIKHFCAEMNRNTHGMRQKSTRITIFRNE